MSSHESRDIVEDTPQYRSVMMAPMAAPPMPRSFASMRPAKVAPRAPVQRTEPVKGDAPVWNVANLPSLPAAYFLERSNVYVDGSAQEVANRVCECLRQESIATTFDDEDKNRVICETSDCVRLAVRLFTDQGKVVVEIQRKSGCSYQFREAARSILRTAKGVPSTPKRKFSIPSCVPRESVEQRNQRTQEGFKVALHQLNSVRTDSQLIGMESLEQVSHDEGIAKEVLGGECLEKILTAVQKDPSEENSEMESRQAQVMKRRALSVFANALCSLSKSNTLTGFLESNKVVRSEALISALLDSLKDSQAMPHEATQAARCLQRLVSSRAVEAFMMGEGASTVVSAACSTGACRSVMLERESKKLKMNLSSCV